MVDIDTCQQDPIEANVIPLAPEAAPPQDLAFSVSSVFAVLGPIGIWSAGLYGSLSMGGFLDDQLGEHSFCGPWGCGPTTGALVSWHSFSALLIIPPVVLAACRLPGSWVRWLAYTLTGGGAMAIIALTVWVAFTWLPHVDPEQPTYLVERCLFVLFADRRMVSIPIMPITLAGVILLLGPWSRAIPHFKANPR